MDSMKYETAMKLARGIATQEFKRGKARDRCGATHPTHYAADALSTAERFLIMCGHDSTFGVESVTVDPQNLENSPGLLYLNSGDSYGATIGYDVETETFLLTSWADWLESAEIEYAQESGLTRDDYSGEWCETETEFPLPPDGV